MHSLVSNFLVKAFGLQSKTSILTKLDSVESESWGPQSSKALFIVLCSNQDTLPFKCLSLSRSIHWFQWAIRKAQWREVPSDGPLDPHIPGKRVVTKCHLPMKFTGWKRDYCQLDFWPAIPWWSTKGDFWGCTLRLHTYNRSLPLSHITWNFRQQRNFLDTTLREGTHSPYHLTLCTPWHAPIFTILLTIRFLKLMVLTSRICLTVKASSTDDHFLYSRDLNKWFSCVIVRRNLMLVSLRVWRGYTMENRVSSRSMSQPALTQTSCFLPNNQQVGQYK